MISPRFLPFVRGGTVGLRAMALAMLLSRPGALHERRALVDLERELLLAARHPDGGLASDSTRSCSAALRRLSRALRWRGAAGLALGDGLARERELLRSAAAEGRWRDALAAARAAVADLDEARRLR